MVQFHISPLNTSLHYKQLRKKGPSASILDVFWHPPPPKLFRWIANPNIRDHQARQHLPQQGMVAKAPTQMEDFQENLVMFSNASLSVIGSSRININISPNEVVIIRQSPAHCSSWDLQKTIEHLLVQDFAPQSTVIYSNIYLSTHLILPYLLYSISRSNLINLISDCQSILPIFLIYSMMINFQVQAADCWVFSTKKVRKVTIHNVLGYPNWLGCYLVSPAIQPPFQWVKAMSQVSQLWHTLG